MSDEGSSFCKHSFHEMDTYLADGVCPICISEQSANYAREIARLKVEIEQLKANKKE